MAALATIGYGPLTVRETPSTGYPKPRLRDRVRDAVRARHYSRSTEKTYAHWIKRKRYIFFHGKRHPAEMGAAEPSAFPTSPVVHDKVASSTLTVLGEGSGGWYRSECKHDRGCPRGIRAGRDDHYRVANR